MDSIIQKYIISTFDDDNPKDIDDTSELAKNLMIFIIKLQFENFGYKKSSKMKKIIGDVIFIENERYYY